MTPADRIAALEAEVERLKEAMARHDGDGDFWHKEACAAREEAKGLREALGRIESARPKSYAASMARAALERKP